MFSLFPLSELDNTYGHIMDFHNRHMSTIDVYPSYSSMVLGWPDIYGAKCHKMLSPSITVYTDASISQLTYTVNTR